MPPTETPPPKMNRAQLRAFKRWLCTPEGKREVAKVKARNEAARKKKAEMDAAVKAATS